MATRSWTPYSGASPIQFFGILEFKDMHIPVPGQDEWGVNTLTRTMRGPGDAFETFINTLDQGDTFTYNGKTFYLQTWSPIDHPVFPGATLNYKGFLGTFTSNKGPSTTSYERVELVSSISDDGLSITYGDFTIIAGTKEVKYDAPQATFRYLHVGAPSSPSHSTVSGDVVVLDSSITAELEDADGNITTKIFRGNAPAGLVSALAGTAAARTIGPMAEPIHGTGIFECIEIVRKEYPGS